MDELDELQAMKRNWIKEYRDYGLTLCLAVLATGAPDDMGDPASMKRHRMVARSIISETGVKIIATEKSGSYLSETKDYSITRRLIVTDRMHRAAYMTYTNEPRELTGEYDVIVPGAWMQVGDQAIINARIKAAKDCSEKEQKEIEILQHQLLIGEAGFGATYGSRLKEKE